MAHKSTLIAIASLVFSTGVNAAVVEADYQSPGDGLITLDVDNGREWLDVTATVGVSVNQAVSIYAPEGFRLATTEEVIALFVSAGIDEILDFSTFPPITVYGSYDFEITFDPNNVSSAAGQAAVANLMDLLGFTNEEFGWLTGHLADEDGDGFHDLARLRKATAFSNAAAHTNSSGDAFVPDVPSEFHGSWLVRDAAVVPLPAAVWLFGAALVSLVGVGRRRRQSGL